MHKSHHRKLIRKESLSDLEIVEKEKRKEVIFNRVASGDSLSNYSKNMPNKKK